VSVYLLAPVAATLRAPFWHTSSVTEPVLVGAASEGEARQTAARKTKVIPKPGTRYDKINVGSPWYYPALASCSLDTSGAKVALGEVITLARPPRTQRLYRRDRQA
jgi:hypothetical protein